METPRFRVVKLLWIWVWSLEFIYLRAAPVRPTDNFTSPCPFLGDSLQPIGFKKWSDPNTWIGKKVPGINSNKGANATIPCGMAILLDVPFIELHTLRIQGLMKFLDDPSLPNIYVRASFILVEGRLVIGSKENQFKSKATIELTPNLAWNRARMLFTSNPPADTRNPRDLGHKAFAVVGGQVRLHGLPIPSSMPVWCKLARTAKVRDTQIFLDRFVTWPVGSEIVITSTDYEMEQAEKFVIKSKMDSTQGTVLRLDRSINYMHYGNSKLSDGLGGYLDQRAEVALLSRNIVINGTYEPKYNLEGGHFIIFHTQIQQFIEGVEFRGMGQQGKLGRYPIHFHLNGNHMGPSGTVCRKNTIRDSNQRCVVVHATFGMTIEENVAYNTKGHCFMTEEGGETNNTFIRNIGILVNPVTKLIPTENFPDELPETDDSPAIFWMSNPTNNLIGNVAAGSADSGVWFELRTSVRGISRSWSKVNQTNPQNNLLGTVIDNTVHSNNVAGFRLYPHGFFPSIGDVSVTAKFYNLNAYKNPWFGVFSHFNDDIAFINTTLADNRVGMFMNTVQSNLLIDSRVVAFSKNYGNPEYCDTDETWVRCRPTESCYLPVSNGEFGRNIGWPDPMFPSLGVQLNQLFGFEDGSNPNSIVSTQFSGFNDTCWPAAAIAPTGELFTDEVSRPIWNSANSVKNLNFADDSNQLWMTPQITKFNLDLATIDVGEVVNYYTLWDKDGSLIGSEGYVVANNEKILPPNSKSCTFQPSWNAYACPNTCYRSIFIQYTEPAFYNNPKAKVGDFSSLVVTRVSDGKQIQVNGNFNQQTTTWWASDKLRFFNFALLANQTYTLSVKPSNKNPSFSPSSIQISYRDGEGCGLGVNFLVLSPKNRQWKVVPSPSVFFSPCDGTQENVLNPSTFSYTCSSNVLVLKLNVGSSLSDPISLLYSNSTTACSSTIECGIMSMGSSNWKYDASGEESPDFVNPLFDDSSWGIGNTPFGYRDDDYPFKSNLSVPGNSLVTYYFRKQFVLRNTACYKSLNVDALLNDGIVIYLNDNELLRANMPSGSITNSTLAISNKDGNDEKSWTRISVDLNTSKGFLVENTNYLSVEVHVFQTWAWQVTFDIRISALRSLAQCQGAKITPEVCDGVDNDNNGRVDEDINGRPLTRPCSTTCGKGIETCTRGLWENCTAPPVKPERCNNIDDNCDGLIDNGLSRLDCQVGKVCYHGSCRSPLLSCSGPNCIQIQKQEYNFFDYNSNWRYLDASLPLPPANWMSPLFSDKNWLSGVGLFGFGDWDPDTRLKTGKTSSSRITKYFRKSFSVPDGNCFYQLNHTLYATDGAVVYLNGIEVYRQKMNPGPVLPSTLASNWSDWSEIPTIMSGSWLRKGTNLIAVEIHLFGDGYGEFNTDGVFGSQLTGRREGKTCMIS